MSAAPVRDPRGRVVAEVVTAYDITEEKRDAAVAVEALARMRAFVEASPLPTVAKDVAGRVTVWNRAAQRTFGWTEDEVVGQDTPIIPEDKRQEHADLVQRARRGERISGLIVTRRRRDGTVLPLMLSVAPVHDAEGAYLGNIAMYADLSERTRFLQTAAHELRNPIAGVKVVATLLRRKAAAGDAPADLERLAGLMEHEVDHLAKLSEDMLEAFRIQEGRIPLHPRRIDLAEVAASALRPYREAEGRHRFTLQAPGEPAWVWGDFDRLEEVVRNLLGNAVKYAPGGGDVRVGLTAGPERVRLSVADSGLGIPADQVHRVFEAFFRGSNLATRDPGGMGLGLFICRDLVERHGGAIWAESQEGRGATFHVELPLCGMAGPADRGGTPPEA